MPSVKRKKETLSVAFRIPKDLYKKIKKQAEAEGALPSVIMRRILLKGL